MSEFIVLWQNGATRAIIPAGIDCPRNLCRLCDFYTAGKHANLCIKYQYRVQLVGVQNLQQLYGLSRTKDATVIHVLTIHLHELKIHSIPINTERAHVPPYNTISHM